MLRPDTVSQLPPWRRLSCLKGLSIQNLGLRPAGILRWETVDASSREEYYMM